MNEPKTAGEAAYATHHSAFFWNNISTEMQEMYEREAQAAIDWHIKQTESKGIETAIGGEK